MPIHSRPPGSEWVAAPPLTLPAQQRPAGRFVPCLAVQSLAVQTDPVPSHQAKSPSSLTTPVAGGAEVWWAVPEASLPLALSYEAWRPAQIPMSLKIINQSTPHFGLLLS